MIHIEPAQRERPPVRDPPVHLSRDRVRTRQPGQRIESGRLLHPVLGQRPHEVREPHDADTPPGHVDHGHVVRRAAPAADGDHVQHLPGRRVDAHRPRRVAQLRGGPVGVQGVPVAPRHRQQEAGAVHRPHGDAVPVHEQHPGDVRRPGQQRPHLPRRGGRGQQRGRPYELPYRGPRTRCRYDTGGAGRNVHVRRRQPRGRREQLPLRQLRPGRPRGSALRLRLDALDGQQRPQLVAQHPHRPYGRRPGQQRRVELHQLRRQIRQQPQRRVPVTDPVRTDPEALAPQPAHRLQQSMPRHMRVRRTDVDRHLPRHPPRLPHGAVQTLQATEVGERAREHVDVQRQQRLLAHRRAERRHHQPAVEFGVAARLGQDVAGLRAGEYLQRRDPAGHQVDHRLEGEAESVRPGAHGSRMAPQTPVRAQFTRRSRRIPARSRSVRTPSRRPAHFPRGAHS